MPGTLTSLDSKATETTLREVKALQTSGAQKTQIVDGSGNVVGTTGNALDINIDAANDEVAVCGSSDGGTTRQIVHTDLSGDVQVDVLSSALPAGAATDTKQDAQTALLGTIDADTSKIPADPAREGGNLATVLARLDVALSTRALESGGNLAAILAKLSADPATQTTLAAVLAKLSADPATQTTLAAVLAQLDNKTSTLAKESGGVLSDIKSQQGNGSQVAKVRYEYKRVDFSKANDDGTAITLDTGTVSGRWELAAFRLIQSGGTAVTTQYAIAEKSTASPPDVDTVYRASSSTAKGTLVSDTFVQGLPCDADASGYLYLFSGRLAGGANDSTVAGVVLLRKAV